MFRQLGISMAFRGVYDVARAFDRLNLAYRSYSRVAGIAARQSVAMARAADQVARSNIQNLKPSFQRATAEQQKWGQAIIRTQTALGDYNAVLRKSDEAKDRMRGKIGELTNLYKDYYQAQEDLSNSQDRSGVQHMQLTNRIRNLQSQIANLLVEEGKWHSSMAESEKVKGNVTRAVQEYIKATAEQNLAITGSKKSIEDYNKALAEGKITKEQYEEAMKAARFENDKFAITMEKLRAGAMAAISSFQMFVGVVQGVGGILQGIGRVVTTILRPFIRLAEVVGRTLVNAFKTLIRLPFNLLQSAFNGLRTSLQRIFDIVIGTSLSRGLHSLGRQIRDLGRIAFDAAVEFQLIQVRLLGLTRREFINAGYELGEAMRMAKEETAELVDWVTYLSVTSIFDAEQILEIHALAMAFDFTTQQAKDLTDSILNFGTGMGLTGEQMHRLMINLGQMKQQGKITGNELRNLARGSLVPVGAVLEQIGVNLELISGVRIPSLALMRENLQRLNRDGTITNEMLEKMNGQLDDLSYGSTISENALLTLAKSGEWSAEMFEFLGTSIDDLQAASDDLTFDNMATEINKLIALGEISVDEFAWAFIDMVNNQFPGAVHDASVTMKVAVQNIRNFIVEMLGWRVLAPAFEVISQRMVKSLHALMGEDMRVLYNRMGDSVQLFTKIFFTWVDQMSMFSFDTGGINRIVDMLSTLFGVFSAINKQDEELFTNARQSLIIFLRDLDIFDWGSIYGITEALEDLFDVFANLDELTPQETWERIRESLVAIFEPLWEDFFKPEINKLIDNVRDMIVDKWQNEIRPALEGFLKDVVLPALNEFITVTIPGWASTIAEHIPKIATAFGTTLYNALDSVSTWAGNNEGILARTVEVLADMGKFLGLKIGVGSIDRDDVREVDPRRGVQSDFEASGLKESLNKLAEAANEAIEPLKNLLTEALDPLIEWADNSKELITTLDSIYKYLESLVALDFPIALANLFSVLFGGDPVVEGDREWLSRAIFDLGAVVNELVQLPLKIAAQQIENLTDIIIAIREFREETGKLPLSFTSMADILGETFGETGAIDFAGIGDFINSVSRLFHISHDGPLYNALEGIRNFRNDLSEIGNEPIDQYPFEDITQNTPQMIRDMIEEIREIDADIADSMLENWQNLTLEGVQNLYDELIGHSLIPDMIQAISDFFDANVPPLSEPFDELFEEIKKIIKDTDLEPLGENLLQGLLDGMKTKFLEIIDYVKWMAFEMRRVYAEAEGMGSPSKEWEKLGLMSMLGLQQGLEKGFANIMTSVVGNMGSLRDVAGLTSGGVGVGQQNNYTSSNYDNRNININYQNSNANTILDYETIRALI